jgi:microcystin-dependent protein
MGQPYVGEIRLFAGNFAPQNWMFCDGSVLPISQYDVLFNLIGTTYGGDGQSTFALPDLRGRIPIHQGPGFTIGQISGTESVTLTVNQIPAHSHAPLSASTGGTSDSPTRNVWANWTGSQYSDQGINQGIIGPMNSGVLTAIGGSQPHDNVMPFVAISFIISLFGIFPSQN